MLFTGLLCVGHGNEPFSLDFPQKRSGIKCTKNETATQLNLTKNFREYFHY